MSLEGFAGSQLPNAIGLSGMMVVTTIAYAKSRSHSRLWKYFAALSLVFAAAIGAKNLAYYSIITRPSGENNPAALDNYAVALNWVVGAQVAVVLGMLVVWCFAKDYARLATVAAAACMYAAVCMRNWSSVYASHVTGSPVHFELAIVPLHVLLLSLLPISMAMSVWSYALRKMAR